MGLYLKISRDHIERYLDIYMYISLIYMYVMYISYLHMGDRENKANIALRKSETF